MSTPFIRCTRLPAVLLLSGLLAACSGMAPAPQGDTERLQAAATILETQGDYTAAAQLYLDAAAGAAVPEKFRLQLSAADSLIRGGEPERAAGLIASLQQAGLQGRLALQLILLEARLALAQHRLDEAMQLLSGSMDDAALDLERRQLQADVMAAGNQYFSAASERIAIDALLADPQQQLANQRAIWDALNSLTDNDLQVRRTAPPPDVLSGWLELVELARLYLQQPDALAEVLPHWQQRYPGHPASGAFLTSLLDIMRTAGQAPEHIAVLLPMSGALSAASGAVRDGIMTAWYDMPADSQRPMLRFHDTTGSAAGTLQAYQAAVTEGALFVLGPLLKEEVEALARLDPLPVPTLALNRIDGAATRTDNLYQFGLAPEDEAREAARLARSQDRQRCVALVSNDSWGERVYSAFAQEWQLLGGTLLESQLYDDSQTDHAQAISAALNLDASEARQQALTRLLGTRLEFTPRRRQDVDCVFLVASPRQARLLRPQLSFHHATGLPVYATSRVYTGQPDPGRDIDMNGISFCDMPWTLEERGDWQHLQQAVQDNWPDNSEQYARLYALGIDALRIVPYLSYPGQGLLATYHGVSGNLTLDSRGHINRSLRCAEFRNGIPELITADNASVTPAP